MQVWWHYALVPLFHAGMMPWCHGGMMPWWHHTTVYFPWVLGKSGNQCFPDFARIHFHWRLSALSAETGLQAESRHGPLFTGGMGAPGFFLLHMGACSLSHWWHRGGQGFFFLDMGECNLSHCWHGAQGFFFYTWVSVAFLTLTHSLTHSSHNK